MDNIFMIYILPVAVAAALIYGVSLLKKARQWGQVAASGDAGGKDIINEAESIIFKPINAMVYDLSTRDFYPEKIPGEKVKEIIGKFGTLGRVVNDDDDGKDYYSLVKELPGEELASEYTPLNIPQTLDQPPDKLYIPFMVKYPVAIVYDTVTEKTLMEKWGPFVWVGIISIVTIFLLVAGK